MKRIAVLTDVHANLPALEATLAALRRESLDALYITGDVIAIGPQPAECLDLLLGLPQARFVRGNHEQLFVEGLPEPLPAYFGPGEGEHQRWLHALLGPARRERVALWPMQIVEEIGGVRVSFQHYALTEDGLRWKPIRRKASVDDLDALFASTAPLVFFGHDHAATDVQGRSRYVNPGSLGCHLVPQARYVIAEFWRGTLRIAHHAVPYDDAALYRAFEEREVPARADLYRTFFGGRFHTAVRST